MLHKDVSVEFTNFVCFSWNQVFQHMTNAFVGMGMLGINWAIMMTMQPSLTTMKTVTACEQALHLMHFSQIQLHPALSPTLGLTPRH